MVRILTVPWLRVRGGGCRQPADAYLPIDLNVRPTASPSEVLQAVTACGGLLSSALATASPTLRAWHWGSCDPEGFAAMGVAETLLHTHGHHAGTVRGLATTSTAERSSTQSDSSPANLPGHSTRKRL